MIIIYEKEENEIFLHTGDSTAQATHDRCVVVVHHLIVKLSFVRIANDHNHYEDEDK